MMLLTKKIRKQLPPLYATENQKYEAVAWVKFFTPDSSYVLYATEFDGEDRFFGLVVGQVTELGYFSLKEMESVRGPLGLPIERDMYFKPATIRELLEKHKEMR